MDRNSSNGLQKSKNDKMHWRNSKKIQTLISTKENKQYPEIWKNKASKNGNNIPYFHFTRLKNLISMNDDEVMTILNEKEAEFQNFMSGEMKSDVLVLTLRVLVKVCQANFTELVTRILSQACSTDFLKILLNYLKNLPLETDFEKSQNKFYHTDINRFWSDLIEFSQKIVELIPRTACDKLMPVIQKVINIITITESYGNYKIDESIKNTFAVILEDLKEKTEILKEKDVSSGLPSTEEQNPPESFRILSVIPTVHDLFEEKPFLRPCKIKDAYDSVEHYLDVQFRLLKEDFVQPLRHGIKEYLEGNKNSRNSDFRIYKSTQLIPFDNKENNVGIKLFFGNLKFVNWRHSKRLMYGSLLLLSRDNFKSILFVTVSNRDERQLVEGYITIEPCKNTTITQDMYKSTFILLESKIYFEPYFEVLTAMKNIYDADFPMESYLIKAATTTNLPHYLQHQPVMKFKKDLLLPIGQDVMWPSAHQLNMDESQYNSFKSAITQEFAVIQGPPGTGKTFLALEVARTLLENKKHWLKYGPIVVVCLTNHALDQFLEGILLQECTKSIIRIGNRSKSEVLKPYTLMERRKESVKNSHVNSLLYITKRELEDILEIIQTFRAFINYLKTPNIIVPLECLTSTLHEMPLKKFKTNKDLVEWLIGIDISSSIAKPASSERLEATPATCNTELDENMYTDDDLLLDFFKLNIYSKALIRPLDILDEKIKTIAQHRRNSRNLPANFALRTQEYLYKLMEIRTTLVDEFKRHSILNRNSLPSSNPRWKTYWDWVKRSYYKISQRLLKLEDDFRKKTAQLNEIKQLANKEVMKEHEVIGLTTTCAAKIQSSLRSLRAPIVIIEEAAEILEAHIVCSITKHCQHVILIGDHKQLRPKASVYELGKRYNLNVSLFERMVNIRGECMQLAYQHRMRPEIAKLITPSIYETLYNDGSVLNYPNVKGVENNVFFLDHSHSEESYNNEESYKNMHEVKFFLAFAKHLIFQGYKPSEISILCTYTGQLFTFMNEIGHHELLKQVRVTTVDNYQGEENKIILLSLVRNNGDGKVGFLKEENRVCVALSRAKEGLYIMGNMNDLLEKNNIWPKIKKVLEEDNEFGDSLTLRCQIHRDQYLKVKSADDFKQCPEGGCSKKCDLLLSCGHYCTSICHVLDREHKEFQCKKSCMRNCPNNHPCPLFCWQKCQPCTVKVEQLLKCGHTVEIPCSADPNSFPCPVEVEVTLPDCQHIVMKACSISLEECKCTHKCEIRLSSCGHTCRGICHVRTDPDHLSYKCTEDCARKNVDCSDNHNCRKKCFEKCDPCAVLIGKKRSCGHYYKNIKCSDKIEDIFCAKNCNRIMTCGHRCKLKCSDECKNCPEKVNKISVCGHTVNVKCCEEATPSKCFGKCPKLLPCGHPCTRKCKDPCTPACQTLIPLNQPGLCGHVFSVPCYLQNSDPKSRALLKYCKQPCEVKLLCEHKCRGNCGKCLQGRLHVSCDEPCRTVFICGHNCEIRCNQECQPCSKTCELRCSHNRCIKKCGEVCTTCKEKCDYKCEHRQCQKLCHELCDVEPCNEPCKNMLKCNHPCIGFCGEPCPPLCRICNKEELTDWILSGNEDDANARFVFLNDCNHCVENEGLVKWIKVSTNSDEPHEIRTPTCPKCKKPIKSCMRIMNQIKENLENINSIKKLNFSNNRKDLEKKQIEYLQIVNTMIRNPVLKDFTEFKNYLLTIIKLGSPTRYKKRQVLNHIEINVFKNVIDLLAEIVVLLESLRIKPNATFEFISNQVVLLVESLPKYKFQMSKQRLDDVQLEMRRLHLMVQIYNKFSDLGIIVNDQKKYKIPVNQPELQTLMNKLCSFQKFTPEVEEGIISSFNQISKTIIKIEREMIVKAMGLGKGRWFRCPNGHTYAIGDCGGAMQRGKCNECNATIGGENHHLVANNTLDTEMDGATRHAYPGGLY